MEYLGVALIIGLFISNAFGLDCLYNGRYKTAGVLDILNLCMVVALAYTFKQIRSIVIVLIIAAAACALFFIIRYFIGRKKKKEDKKDTQETEAKPAGYIDADIEEKENEI